MNLRRLAAALFARLSTTVAVRAPDFVVGATSPGGAYLRRWYVIPRNRWFNVHLHQFLRDDDDRALHDHPWWSASLMLDGAYIEHTIAPGGIHRREMIEAGTLRVRSAAHAHRIELLARRGDRKPCWTLFITGPVVRRWGFHCPQQGWIDFVRFTRPGNTGETGAGCDA